MCIKSSLEEARYKDAVNIPPTVDYEGETYDVTAIGKSAFANCTNLTSVTIPESVTTIGDRAFQGCGGLASITLPSDHWGRFLMITEFYA